MINEETLTLYFYDDGLSDTERQQVEAALQSDADLAAAYSRLCRELEQWREPEADPAPAHLKQRWHDSIDKAARAEIKQAARPHAAFHWFSFAWGAAMTAVLVLGIGIGVYFSGNTPVIPTIDNSANGIPVIGEPATPVSFTRGLQLHLQDSQSEIAGLPTDASADRVLLLAQIIEQNRMFERAAKQNNSPGVARVLRAFEPILIRLASDDIAPEDAEALRAQLAFELGVVLTKLAQDTSNETHST